MAAVIAAAFPADAEAIRARAAEAYESRIWAGIHFRHEMVAGKAIGLAVAEKVLAWGADDLGMQTNAAATHAQSCREALAIAARIDKC
jgi:hypothetical protein